MMHQFSFSSQEVRRVKRIQFGVLSPDEIVSSWGLACGAFLGRSVHLSRAARRADCARDELRAVSRA